ncbi:MAG: sulfite exporter TauE/SafE family protein, partial [Clostridiales bacterium]|nr:sulfite exporter TauE/SafE family protein [Candidatus Equinaster intestinalis]
MLNDILFVLTMTFGVFVQALAGFGGPLFAMPIGIMLCGIGLAKPVMTILAWLTGITVVITEYKYIKIKELIKMVAVMLVGVLGSLWVSDKINLNFLLIFYGIIVAGIGAKRLFVKSKKETSPLIQNVSLGLAGIMQGLF